MYEAQIRDLETARNKDITDNRTLWDSAHAANRDLTPAEEEVWEKRNVAIEKRDRTIESLKRLQHVEPSGEANGENRQLGTPRMENRGGAVNPRAHATEEYRDAYHYYLATGERRDMIVTNQVSGGYLLAPASVSAEIIKQVDNLVFVKKLAKKFPVTSTQATGVRQMTSRMDDPSWTTEIQQIPNADTGLAFGRRDLQVNPLVKLVKVSERLLMQGPESEGIVNTEMAYKYAVSEENNFYNGDGVGKPLGLFNRTNSSAISSTRDFLTATAGVITGDDLITLKYSLKQGYLASKSAAWSVNRTFVAYVRMLKTTQNQYIWREGLSSDRPDTILDLPFNMSEYVPGVIASGNIVACLGNLEYYGVAELADMAIKRLNELYQGTNEIGFKGIAWLDGQPLLDEAFSFLKVR